ncbi:MAG: hypothetical protein FD143_3040 [Ignavibacteria bacterium]|nr:MAG: hypothetical protein FD143_3040 [Ignavibacteria bacterium]
MQLEQARRVALFTLLILASVYAPAINAQRIKDLPKINKYDVYTDALTILFDRHDSTKTTKTRYLKYGIYKWQNAKEFEPKYYRQNTTPSTSADSNSIWFDTNTNHLKYLDKKNSVWVLLDSLKRTHIDPTGVYTKKAAIEKLMIDTLKVGGQIEIVNNSQITGLNATKTYKQATDPSISNSLNIGDLWINTSSSDRFATYYWTGAAWTSYLPGIWDAPSGSGLLLNQNYMGHYSGGSFQTYIRDNGYFYFKGDVNNYISWQGDTLKIKGKITALNSNDFGTATIFRQATQPVSGMEMNDVWFDSDDGDKPYVYYSGSWIPAYTTIDGGYLKTGVIDASLAKIKNMVADSIKSGVFTGLTFQTANVGNARVRINGSNNRIEWVKADNTVGSYLDQSGGNMVLSGKLNMTSSDTITGGVIRTASSGARAELNGANNDLRFYSTTGGVIGTMASGSNILRIDGSSLTLTGSVTSDITLQTFSAAGFYGDINLTSSRNIEATGSGSFTWNGSALATQSFVTSQGYITSEIQTLGTSGNTITLTGGGSVTAPYATSAGSVTNGVYTTGSYSNPSWITQIADSKVRTGSGGNLPAYFDGSGNLALGSVAAPISISAGSIGLSYDSGTMELRISALGTKGASATQRVITGITVNSGGANAGLVTGYSYKDITITNGVISSISSETLVAIVFP